MYILSILKLMLNIFPNRPVLVVVRHEKGVLSWQLPLITQVSDFSTPTDIQKKNIPTYRAYPTKVCIVFRSEVSATNYKIEIFCTSGNIFN